MRILFVTSYSKLYGANRSLLSIIEKSKRSGDEVCLFLPGKGNYAEELEKKGIKYEVIPYNAQLFYYRKTLPYLILPLLDIWTFLFLPYIIYKAKVFCPDLIYSNSTAENLGIIVAKSLGVKHITHVRDFMDLDHRYIFLFGREAKKKYICKSDGVVYVSKAVANHTLLGNQLPINHKVIYNGVYVPKEFFFTKKTSEGINFGIVGLLDESKGQDLAIRVFDRIKEVYPQSKLHIWGDKDGSYKNKLITMIEERNLQGRVIMHGFEKDPSVIYGDMHVLLMCSKAEAFGRVTVEAMMRGIPVIGYNSGGTAEIVKDAYSGYIFNTEEEFIDKVHELFSSDEHYSEICKNAFNDSHENFTEDKYTSEVYDFIRNIIHLS